MVNWLSPFKQRETVITGERGAFVCDTLTADLTFYANTGASGGAITTGEPANITHVTFLNNAYTGGGGGASIQRFSGTTTVKNSVFSSVQAHCSAALTDGGYNLENGSDICQFTGVGSQTGGLTLDLLPLADNGGFTKTVMPGPTKIGRAHV